MSRRGFTLVELLIGMIVAGIVGVALLRLIVGQSQFFQTQDAIREARSASRASLNLILSDLRMVEADGGVASASATQITVLVPYAFGVVCTSSAATTVVSLLPTDSVMYAGPGFSGYAWRTASSSTYSYVEGGITIGKPVAGICAAESITTLAAGSEISLSPGAVGASPGDPIFLFRRTQYSFGDSKAIPGRIGLWRTFTTTGTTEELVAPFQNTAKFQFYVLNADTSQAAVPPILSNVRGIELLLNTASTSSISGRPSPLNFDLTTAVFFKNRAD